MKRRNFVQKLTIFTTSSLVLSGSNLYALDADPEIKKQNTSIDLASLTFNDKK
ncbi:hypothetical protein FIA58_018980 [Flavobacterium jejuense]|uniref:Uncharacterized protein n=1 Tax=Flavobacterium jejuense TaxID=1544455 RepID=A0ABX0IY57_9FLAO|nr:hypothetical protein [Flavobacterium jejuense]NHN27769.1 hypothetical protein [Flavobacterium jejuense]